MFIPMKKDFKVGDYVGWNSEAGHVRGTIKKKITSAITFKGYTVRASKEEPQYLIKSDKTDHLAMHKGSRLKKRRSNNERAENKENCRLRGKKHAKGRTFAAGNDDRSFHAHARGIHPPASDSRGNL